MIQLPWMNNLDNFVFIRNQTIAVKMLELPDVLKQLFRHNGRVKVEWLIKSISYGKRKIKLYKFYVLLLSGHQSTAIFFNS